MNVTFGKLRVSGVNVGWRHAISQAANDGSDRYTCAFDAGIAMMNVWVNISL